MILDTTGKYIYLYLDTAIVTSQLPITVSYVDHTPTTCIPAASDTQTNDTSAVTIVAAPAASTQRQIKSISIYNADTTSATLTIFLYNGTGARILRKITLAVGQTETFDGVHWIETSISPIVPSGALMDWPMPTAPTDWLLANGAAVSRATFATLFGILVPSMGNFTVTIASPAVVTLAAHGKLTGDQVYLTTTGALPTGLVANTLYYIIKIDADTFNLATSRANADAGTKINTSGTQSGTHTCMFCPWGNGDGTTTFNTPNYGGQGSVGFDNSQTEFNNLGESGGAKTHTLLSGESGLVAHSHPVGGTGTLFLGNGAGYGSANITTGGGVYQQPPPQSNTAANAVSAHNNLQPYRVANKIIKT